MNVIKVPAVPVPQPTPTFNIEGLTYEEIDILEHLVGACGTVDPKCKYADQMGAFRSNLEIALGRRSR